MSQTNHFAGTPGDCTKPLDLIMWRAWIENNRQQDIQRAFAWMKAVKWACVGLLLATVVVSSSVLTALCFRLISAAAELRIPV